MVIQIELTNTEAMALAQFLKRACFSDYRSNAVDEEEAYQIRDAASHLQDALALKGFAPR